MSCALLVSVMIDTVFAEKNGCIGGCYGSGGCYGIGGCYGFGGYYGIGDCYALVVAMALVAAVAMVAAMALVAALVLVAAMGSFLGLILWLFNAMLVVNVITALMLALCCCSTQ
jgi:hypothetical protein